MLLIQSLPSYPKRKRKRKPKPKRKPRLDPESKREPEPDSVAALDFDSACRPCLVWLLMSQLPPPTSSLSLYLSLSPAFLASVVIAELTPSPPAQAQA